MTVPVADQVTGNWTITCQQEDGVAFAIDTIVASWGVSQTATVAANDARDQATLARQIVGNEQNPNSPTAPTSMILKDDNGNPFMTRTIRNGDGTVASPQQILKFGKFS